MCVCSQTAYTQATVLRPSVHAHSLRETHKVRSELVQVKQPVSDSPAVVISNEVQILCVQATIMIVISQFSIISMYYVHTKYKYFVYIICIICTLLEYLFSWLATCAAEVGATRAFMHGTPPATGDSEYRRRVSDSVFASSLTCSHFLF